ncbi:hypothetical protein C5167_044090, partial [Papaver somniferum]
SFVVVDEKGREEAIEAIIDLMRGCVKVSLVPVEEILMIARPGENKSKFYLSSSAKETLRALREASYPSEEIHGLTSKQ